MLESNGLQLGQKPALNPAMRMNVTDTHDKNNGSILSTVVSDANNRDLIMFTGDGGAHRIEMVINERKTVLNPNSMQPPPNYWTPIYKRRHHGGHLKAASRLDRVLQLLE